MVREKYAALFEPINIGRVDIKNRVAMAPIGNVGATHDGYVTEQMKSWFIARAKGGTGLIITGSTFISEEVAKSRVSRELRLYDRSHIYGMSELAEAIHAFNVKVFVQLSPGPGRQGGLKAPSAIPYHIPVENLPPKMLAEHRKRGLKMAKLSMLDGPVPPVLTIDEIVQLEDMWADAVELARQCSFDGVELDSAYGWLAHQFLSPRSNKRNDSYGGNLENRMRFLANSLIKARKKVGRDYCIGFRISGDEHMPEGFTHDEIRKICKKMEELGADYVHLIDGCWEALKWAYPEDHGRHILGHAESLKNVVKIPVITTSVSDPDLAEGAIKAGRTDMISLGRALIADPNWANKIAEGKRPVKCLLCGIGCQSRLGQGTPLRCMVNPVAGFEQYVPEYRLSPPFKKNWELY